MQTKAMQARKTATKLFVSLGTAIVTSRIARAIAEIRFDDVLGGVGLARRRGNVAQHILLFGVGAVIGAGTALLLAPAEGSETRQRLRKGLRRLSPAKLSGRMEPVRDMDDEGGPSPGRESNGPGYPRQARSEDH